mgnify:CR=1 FL=1
MLPTAVRIAGINAIMRILNTSVKLFRNDRKDVVLIILRAILTSKHGYYYLVDRQMIKNIIIFLVEIF